MSALPLPLPTRNEEAREHRRAGFRSAVSTAPRRKPKIAYALMALAGAALIGVAQIALTVATTHDSFVLGDLKTQQRELDLRADALQEELAGVSSPQALAGAASRLGMVVVGSPAYLRLSDGSITGDGTNTGWISSVDPVGSSVANALLAPPAPPAEPTEADESAAGASSETAAPPVVEPELPPSLDQGLPSPTTH